MKIYLVLLLMTLGHSGITQSNEINTKKMKIAVWDTYVKIETGEVVHFDVLVPDHLTDADKIFKYGKAYLASKKMDGKLDTKHCQFCHIEEASPEMVDAIKSNGFDIIEMETIPVKLQTNPTRRQMILFLRAHFDQYRFADFKSKSEEDIKNILISENIIK